MDSEKAPLVVAGDRIRETAKWLTVSLAALGGILIAGTQFSSIGSLMPGSPRFTQAAWGGGLAAAGTILILAGAVWTATTQPVRLSILKNGRPEFDDPALLQGRPDVEALRAEYIEAVGARQLAVQKNLKEGSTTSKKLSESADIHARYVSGIVQNVLQVGSYYKLARTWRKAAWMVGAGSVVAAAGLLLFIWAANPPAAALKSLTSPAVVGEPPVRMMTLTESGQRLLQPDLGASCVVSEPLAVLFLDATESGADVVVQQHGCRSMRLLVTPEWGMVRTDPGSP